MRFLGGMGNIKIFHSKSNTWADLVEMEMGAKPDFGTIGTQTTILLPGDDI